VEGERIRKNRKMTKNYGEENMGRVRYISGKSKKRKIKEKEINFYS
jgi:hypothetical protein